MNPDPVREMIEALRQSAAQLAGINEGLNEIDHILTGGALAGGPGDLLIEALHDRTIFGTVQMRNRLGELAGALEVGEIAEPAPSDEPTLLAFYQPFKRFLSPALFAEGEQAEIENLLRRFPVALSQSLLLECRLHRDAPQVDFSLRIDPALDRGRALLANWPDSGRTWGTPAWGRVRDFCAAWADPSSPLHEGVATVWLEFDPDKASGSLLPSLFFTHRTDTLLRPGENEVFTSPDEEVVEAALRLLVGRVSDPLWEQVARCRAALPIYSGIRWTGVMLSRQGGGVRLCIEMQYEQIADFLEEIGCGEAGQRFIEQAAPYLHLFDVPVLAIEVTESGVQPRIGAECRYFKQRQPEIEPRWSQVIEALARDGYCEAAKGRAVQSWGGYFYARLPGVSVPQVFTRSVSHIKIQTQPGSGLEAKAYLACTARPVGLEKHRHDNAAGNAKT